MEIIEGVLPMYLDIYAQVDSQDPDTGAILKEWHYIDTFPCYAKGVVSNSTSARSSDKQIFNTKYSNSQMVQIRTMQKLSIRNKVTNIRTKEGINIWTELDYPSETPTVFEVTGVTPITDPFGEILAYNALAKRSENQQIGI
jgi:hypothetical protein